MKRMLQKVSSGEGIMEMTHTRQGSSHLRHTQYRATCGKVQDLGQAVGTMYGKGQRGAWALKRLV